MRRRAFTLLITLCTLLVAAAPGQAAGELPWAFENEALWPGGPSPYGTDDADVDARRAWSVTEGDGVVVAVIDTGVDASHPDLAGALVPGWDFVQGDNRPHDGNGHGTHVAGTIAGPMGMAPNAKVMPLRVLDRYGDGSSRNLARAINYAVRHDVDVINLSVGHFSRSRAVSRALRRADRKGIVVVAAAGNGGEDLDEDRVWPASYPRVLAVTCSDASDELCPKAARGRRKVALAAPGASIIGPKRGGGRELRTGSSQATALTSGAAALVRAAAPGLSARQVRIALVAGADRPAGLEGLVRAGRLNAGVSVTLSTSGRMF